MRILTLVLLTSAVVFLSTPSETSGCAAAPPRGGRVDVNSEEAIILYDAAAKTEHFIRRADFRTNVKDFGFLVPTPSKPELGEAESSVFGDLQRLTAQRHEFSGVVKKVSAKRGMAGEAMMAPAAPLVLDRKQVAGYDAVVLQADDLEGLRQWLEKNQYDARPAVMDWLKRYVELHWIITAFKVALDADAASNRWSKSVRMSFETERPFYPYREPEDMRTPDPKATASPARKLRVYLLADARFEGTLGEADAWPGKAVWSNGCPRETATQVVKGLGMTPKTIDSLGDRSWHLTEFEDNSSPRPGTDEVFFRRAADQSSLERPVIYFDRIEYVYDDDQTPSEEKRTGSDMDGELYRAFLPAAIGLVLVVATGAVLILRRR
jgi:hypothetical protein